MSSTKVRGNPLFVALPLAVILLIFYHINGNALPGAADTTSSGGTAWHGAPHSAPNSSTSTSEMPTRPTTTPANQQGSDVRGVDISNNNGSIGWNELAKHAGFVYIKASEGAGWTDPNYHQYVNEAEARHIPHGAYEFFRPQASIDEQVSTFLAQLGSMHEGDLPPMLDLEFLNDTAAAHAEWLDLSVTERANRVLAYLHQIECATGVTPILYISPSFAHDVIGTQNFAKFAHYHIFVAHWGATSPTVPAPWSDWNLWQYDVADHVGYVQSTHLDFDVVNGGGDGLTKLKFNGHKVSCSS